MFTVGMIARYHQQKDIPCFLESLTLLGGLDHVPRVILAGEGMVPENHDLSLELAARHLTDSVTLLGPTSAVPELLRRLDVLVLPSSHGEGFPNILVEAMASGVPCIATSVGDSAEIVSTFGWIVPPSNPMELSNALRSALKLSPQDLHERGSLGRISVTERFSITVMLNRYEEVMRGLLSSPNPQKPR